MADQMADTVMAERWEPETGKFRKTENLLSAFGFSEWETMPRVISFVGAGGKTSTMYDLARELAANGARILVTTSTHIFKPERYKVEVVSKLADLPGEKSGYFGADAESELKKTEMTRHESENHAAVGKILVAGKQAQGPGMEEKLTMPEDLGDESVMKRLLGHFDVILIEADGSKRLPFKIPSETEPVLIPQTGMVVACAGLKAGGKTFADVCFRFASHGAWLKRKETDIVTAEDIALVFMDERGSRKGLDGRYYRILLNQSDGEAEKKLSESIVAVLPENLQRVCIRTTRMAQEE